MGAESTLRDTLNTADPGRLPTAFQVMGLGELLSLLIRSVTPTEAGIAVTAHVATLAAQPTALFSVKGIGGTAGVKTLRRGTSTDVALPGEVIWDGGVKLFFNAADANTTADIIYALATDKVSVLMQSLDRLG